jgi:hypothetical protein
VGNSRDHIWGISATLDTLGQQPASPFVAVQVAERQDPHGSRSYARAGAAAHRPSRRAAADIAAMPVWRTKQAAPFIDRPPEVV